MLIPLYGFVQGDTLGLLVLAHDHMTVAEVSERLRESARLRVVRGEPAALVFSGRVLDPALTLRELGLRALDRIDLRFERSEASDV